MSVKEYRAILAYLNSSGETSLSWLSYPDMEYQAMVLPPNAKRLRQYHENRRTYSCHSSHHANSLIQFRIPNTDETPITGVITSILELPFHGFLRKFILVAPHRPIDLRNTPYEHYPRMMTSLVEVEPYKTLMVIEPKHVITHLSAWTRPSRTYSGINKRFMIAEMRQITPLSSRPTSLRDKGCCRRPCQGWDKDAARTQRMPLGCRYDKCAHSCPLCDLAAYLDLPLLSGLEFGAPTDIALLYTLTRRTTYFFDHITSMVLVARIQHANTIRELLARCPNLVALDIGRCGPTFSRIMLDTISNLTPGPPLGREICTLLLSPRNGIDTARALLLGRAPRYLAPDLVIVIPGPSSLYTADAMFTLVNGTVIEVTSPL
ncbi:hypothetical protein C8R46DRAFT_1036567 [Mycena filopes]|nr:hypothetical protein C8R46DRAFT_1036567 [Mycena filopes]